MSDIDSLQININATATKANDALDNLVKKLDRLTTSLSSIDGSKLNGLASGVQQLGTAMQTMNNVKTADFTRLAKNLSNLNNLDTSKLSGVSANISKIGTAVSGLSGVSQGVTQITELANGIKQLGYKSADKAIDNIPKLATAMKQLMKELSTAPKVSQNLINMTNALARLARTGASSGKAAQSLSNSFTGIYKSSGFAVSGIKKVNARLVSLIRSIVPVIGVMKLIDFGKQAMEISSDLTEVQNVVDVTFGDYKQKIEDLASVSIPELGMSELSVKEIGSRFQAMGTAMGFSTEKMSDMSVELTRLTGDMASFYNVEQETMGKALQSIFTGETEPMRKYGIDLTNATIQQYALSQGITTSINKMTQLEKAQLRYNYVMAQTTAAQGDFIRTQDTWANQIRILKQNLQQLASIIGGTLINAFKPLIQAINSAMSHIIAFAQTVSNALGKIFGWKFEVGGGGITNDLETGAGAADDIASGMGEAADNAKKLRSHLLAIDELNVYEPTEDSSTSGSSGSGLGNLGSGGASGGEWVQQDSIFKDFESEIDSLYKLGEYIGKVLTDMMNNIDWEAVYEKARNFGKGLADFLNGLISPELFGAVGRTIAGALNTAIYTALSFGETFDWENLGESIAEGINQFFATFDFESLAKTLNTFVDGILEMLSTLFRELDWGAIVEGIGTFLGSLDGDTIAVLIGMANIKKIGKAISKLIGGSIGAEGANEETEILGTAEGIGGLSLAFEGLAFAIEAAAMAAGGLIIFDIVKDPLIDILGEITGNQEGAERLKESYEGLYGTIRLVKDELSIFPSFFSGIPAVMGGSVNASLAMSEALDAIGNGTVYTDKQMQKMQKTWSLLDEDMETLRQAMIDANPEVFEITKNFESLDDVSFETLEDAAYGISLIRDGVVDASTAFDEFRKPMWGMTDDALEFFETLQDGETDLEAFKDSISEAGESISDGLYEGALNADTDTPTKTIFEKFVDGIKSIFGIHSPAEEMKPLGEYIFLGITEGFSSMFETFTETMTEFWENYILPWFSLEKWYELGTGILEGLQTKWEEIKQWWSETAIFEWWENDVKPWFTVEKWSAMLNNIKTSFATKWNETVTQWKTNITKWWNENVYPWFTKERWLALGENLKNGIYEGFKGLANKVVDVLNNVISALESMINSAIAGINDLLSKINESGLGEFIGLELNISNVSFGRIPHFSVGGFPEDGLFYANHNELVGQFSNGKTVVANNEQITEGIKQGVREAVADMLAPYLAEIAQNTRETADKDFEVSLDGRSLLDGLNQRSVRNGYSFT